MKYGSGLAGWLAYFYRHTLGSSADIKHHMLGRGHWCRGSKDEGRARSTMCCRAARLTAEGPEAGFEAGSNAERPSSAARPISGSSGTLPRNGT